jgi:hypothetical protein
LSQDGDVGVGVFPECEKVKSDTDNSKSTYFKIRRPNSASRSGSGAILSLFLGRDVKKRVFRTAMDMKSLRSARKSVASVTRLSSNKANLFEIDLTIPVTVADILRLGRGRIDGYQFQKQSMIQTDATAGRSRHGIEGATWTFPGERS